MNISIKPIKTLVREKYLYNDDETKTGFINGKIIGISTYINFPITFHVMLEGQYLYSDLPIIALCKEETERNFTYRDLATIVCPAYEVNNFTFEYFENSEVSVYLKGAAAWSNGHYVTSFEFYTDNELLHLIVLESGEFALIPNHKINWGDKQTLTDYKKSKITYLFESEN